MITERARAETRARTRRIARVVVEHVRPVVEGGRYPAKAAVGQPLEVSADLFLDGTDLVTAWVRHGPTGAEASWEEVELAATGNDRFAGVVVPGFQGACGYTVGAMPDDYATWLRDLRARLAAGQEDLPVELEEGARLVDERLASGRARGADRAELAALAASLRAPSAPVSARVHTAGLPESVAAMRRSADRGQATSAGPFPLWVDRPLGAFSAWYELFPRSEGATAGSSGTLSTASKRLVDIAAMGFDVVYLPPIHPIGVTNRKGANNTLVAGPDDPGSPWAIGSAAGGHTAVDGALGTLADFDAFVASAAGAGLEVALDYALQCSPDHPWVTEHPDWFRHRSDGTIRYAENPPKRYQDIYPINFDTDDRDALYAALRDVLLFWMDHGVRVFRVDNPHTKPFDFWEWVIGEVRARDPGVILLAEAFTRPKVMQRLAKIGFTQSYTYFTWRNWKGELVEYLTELSQGEEVDWFRPNFWVNTPDILHETLQRGGAGAFRLRLVLAALGAPSWGMYSGYELCESVAARAGSEEYMDSEKYQLRPRDWGRADSLAPLVTRVNDIRRRHREAVSLLRTLRLHDVDNDALLCFSRMTDDRTDVLVVVVNLDPYVAQEATVRLDLAGLGLSTDRPFDVHDELTGASYVWYGPANYVRLDPAVQPAHVLRLTRR